MPIKPLHPPAAALGFFGGYVSPAATAGELCRYVARVRGRKDALTRYPQQVYNDGFHPHHTDSQDSR
jgi:hypothetical protein